MQCSIVVRHALSVHRVAQIFSSWGISNPASHSSFQYSPGKFLIHKGTPHTPESSKFPHVHSRIPLFSTGGGGAPWATPTHTKVYVFTTAQQGVKHQCSKLSRKKQCLNIKYTQYPQCFIVERGKGADTGWTKEDEEWKRTCPDVGD